jgi:hypothetical protein
VWLPRGDYSKGTSLAESASRRGVFFMAARREQERVSFPWQIVARLGEIDATQSGSVPASSATVVVVVEREWPSFSPNKIFSLVRGPSLSACVRADTL